MNPNEFNSLIVGTKPSTDKDLAQYQNVNEFPYCQLFHIVDAKISEQNDSIDLSTKTSKAALYASSRTSLFNFIFKETLQKSLELAEQNSNSEPLSIDSEKLEDEKTIEPVEALNIKKESDETESFDKAELYKKLETQILASAVSSSILQEVSEAAGNDLVEALPIETKVSSEPKVFSDWLKTLSGKAEKKPKFDKQLIDKFIQNDPQITPSKTEFFSPIEKAKLSLAEDETFVTETLAKIYAQQGNFKKAITAYKNLMLKYPEKKRLFAAQIKNLESLIKK